MFTVRKCYEDKADRYVLVKHVVACFGEGFADFGYMVGIAAFQFEAYGAAVEASYATSTMCRQSPTALP